MSNERENHRRFFRLAYPSTMMPVMRVADKEYAVAEISEGGLRIRCANRYEFVAGDEISGEIDFVDGDSIAITGSVMRYDLTDFVIAPLDGISFSRVVSEQRRLLGQCPSVRTE